MTRLVMILVCATACVQNETCETCVRQCAPFVVSQCVQHPFASRGFWVSCACDVTRRTP